MWTVPAWKEIQETLRDPSSPIGMRMRAAYYAKQLFVDLQKEDSDHNDEEKECDTDADATGRTDRSRTMEDIVKVLCEQVFVKEHGSLLRHEFAYVLGQMKTDKACTTLEELLEKEDDCVMVRHEAAEALGAIASPRSKTALESTRAKNEGVLDELADTCLLALNRLDDVATNETDGEGKNNSTKTTSLAVGCACMLAPFNSIDPVDDDPAHVSLSTEELGDILLNKNKPKNTGEDERKQNDESAAAAFQQRGDLIERYRAMFSLRNRGGVESVKQLCRALVEDTSSPLLRHEVAFVLGQLQHPSSIPALEESLARLDEHAMVRHESAEALGAIEGSSEDWLKIESILTKYQKDFDQAVAESCVVALDAADYWGRDNATDNYIHDNGVVGDDEETNKFVEDDHELGTEDNSVEIAHIEKTGGAFGKQKHNSTAVETCEIRKQILAQHFNVVQNA